MSFKNSLLNLAIFIISITIIPLYIFEYQVRDPSEYFIPKSTIIVIMIGILIWYFHQSDEDEDDYNINPYEDNVYYNRKRKYVSNNNPYCLRTDVKTYEKITKSYTNEKMNDLLRTPLFKKMLEEKGEDKENWNWQSRDRLAGKVQPDESDLDDEDMEKMSVSDDD